MRVIDCIFPNSIDFYSFAHFQRNSEMKPHFQWKCQKDLRNTNTEYPQTHANNCQNWIEFLVFDFFFFVSELFSPFQSFRFTLGEWRSSTTMNHSTTIQKSWSVLSLSSVVRHCHSICLLTHSKWRKKSECLRVRQEHWKLHFSFFVWTIEQPKRIEAAGKCVCAKVLSLLT